MNENNAEQRNAGSILRARATHRKWVAVLLVLALAVSAGTLWAFHYKGIAATYQKQVLDCHAISGTVSHIHNADDCYRDGELVCPLEEIEPHEHTEACYTAVLTCGQEENDGHHHTDACFIPQMELTCGMEESDGDETHPAHHHTVDCYSPVMQLVCGLEETAGDETHPAHWHTAECYEEVKLPVCGMEEGEGAHHHTDACYEQVLTCEKQALPLHVHGPECFRSEEMTEEEIAALNLAGDSKNTDNIDDADIPAAAPAEGQEGVSTPEGSQEQQGDTEDPGEVTGNPEITTDIPMQTTPFSFASRADDILVTVEAPAEAFPAGTEMKVRAIYDEQVLSDAADAVEKDENVSGTVVQVQAVDISFWYSGKEVEPLKPIRVVMTPVEAPEFDEQTVVHVDDVGEASLIEQEDVAVPEAAFEVEEFSVYCLVYTKLETTVLASDGNNYKITVTAPDDAPFPENAKLWASEIVVGANAYGITYNEYLTRTEYALGWEAGSASYVRLFDIFVGDQFGNKLPLTTPVDVKIELLDKEAGKESSVVHFGAKTEVMDAETEGQTVSFEANSFSVYAVAENTLTKYVLASDGQNYKISLTYSDDAGIPEGAELVVSEVISSEASDGMNYEDYLGRAERSLDDNQCVTFARFFDITIVADGAEVQPLAPVEVTIELAEELQDQATEEVKALHFYDDGGMRTIPTSVDAQTVSFNADGFSVYGIVGTKLVADVTLPGSDDIYEVTVTYGPEAKIPEGVHLEVAALAADSEEYAAAKKAVIADKQAKDEDFNENDLGFAVLDISIVGEDGIEVEPADGAEVKVSIKLQRLPEGTDEASLNNTLEVLHLNDSNGIVIVETVAEAKDVVVENGSAIAEFTTSSFSTFPLTWTDESATIHFGVLNNGEFVEFDNDRIPSFDTTAGSISVANYFDGFVYAGAYYVNNEENLFIDPILYKAADGENYTWQADMHIPDETSDTTTLERRNIANGSDIYVQYVAKSPGSGNPPSGDDVEGPTTTKTVKQTKNSDGDENGTYTITLSVKGSVLHEETKVGANVLIVLDRTKSMRYNMYNDNIAENEANNRWTAAKAAVHTLLDTLSSGENAQNDVEYALMTFYRQTDGRTIWDGGTPWTDDAQEVDDYVQGNSIQPIGRNDNTNNGTNWEDPLYRANLLVNEKAQTDDDKTYVIFVTDGQPNAWGTGEQGNNYSGYQGDQVTAYNKALPMATSLFENQKAVFYGVFCGMSSGYDTLNALLIAAAADAGVSNRPATINGTDSATIQNEFRLIAQTIIKDLGSTNVSVDDGVTTLSSVSAQVAGEAGGFQYYRSGGKNTDGSEKYDSTANGGLGETWVSPPGASYSPDNGVTWDLSSVGVLEQDVTYRVTFTVWPSQEAYDLIADLNNGVVEYDSLDQKIKAQIGGNKTDGYYMLTNTHLQTTYTYNNQTYTAPSSWEPEDMPLPTRTIKVQKIWNNPYDPDVHDGGASANLYLAKDGQIYLSGENGVIVTAKGLDGILGTADDWISDEVYISCGQIIQDHNGYQVIETGHDYQILEPEDLAYYWDLTSDVYRPMVINGTAKVLIKTDNPTGVDGVDYYTIEDPVLDGNGNPVLDGNGNVTTVTKKYQVSSQGQNILVAVNDRRSFLNLTKVVTDLSYDQGANPDELFPFTCKFTKLDEDIYFSAWDNGAFQEITGTGIQKEIKNPPDDSSIDETGWTGYYYAEANSEFTINIKDGWNIRFINLPVGTEYSLTEGALSAGYSFVSAEGSSWDYQNSKEDAYNITVEGTKITGAMEDSNHSYTITVTNKYEPTGKELKVYKVWQSGDFVTVHGDVKVALYRNGELIPGTVKTITNGENSVTYDKISSFDGLVVREVIEVTTDEGTSVVPIAEGGIIAVSGETTTLGTNSTDTYIATYSQSEATAALREDTVTNTMPQLVVNKQNMSGNQLAGATFKLTGEDGETAIEGYESIGSTDVANGNLLNRIYLSNGTYYLVETSAPDGFNMLTYKIKLTVTDNNAHAIITAATDPESVTNIPDQTPDNQLLYTYNIHNSDGTALPMTGGPGVELFEVIGGILIALAFVALVIRKRRTA